MLEDVCEWMRTHQPGAAEENDLSLIALANCAGQIIPKHMTMKDEQEVLDSSVYWMHSLQALSKIDGLALPFGKLRGPRKKRKRLRRQYNGSGITSPI